MSGFYVNQSPTCDHLSGAYYYLWISHASSHNMMPSDALTLRKGTSYNFFGPGRLFSSVLCASLYMDPGSAVLTNPGSMTTTRIP
jgi:hypothetical protein